MQPSTAEVFGDAIKTRELFVVVEVEGADDGVAGGDDVDLAGVLAGERDALRKRGDSEGS